MSDSQRIAKNTLMLYFRQILIMLVSLYTVRVVLNVLGAEDYGINNVVAGFVTMFNFLSSAMATASQRYFSYDLGKNDAEHLNKTFCITFLIYIFLCVFVLLIAETIGLWFVIRKLVIPKERIFAAIWIYQFSIISFIMTLVTTPYKASIIAHESMDAYAYISIVEVLLKLAVVFVLRVITLDKLIIYGLLQCIVVSTNTLLYRIYAKRKFKECKYHFTWDINMLKEMLSFSGWNLFGSIAYVLKNQGLNIVLNLFFGPIVNAARGVAYQVNNAVVTFSHNFSMAVRPQIVKNYASEDIEKSINLVCSGSKLAYYLMFVFTLPLCLEMKYVLTIWLKNPPGFTVIFTILVLLDALIDSVNGPVITLMQATGKIRNYQILVGTILLFNVPVSYIALKVFNTPAHSIFIIAILLTIIASIVRLIVTHIYASLKIKFYIKKVYLPCFLITIISCIFPGLIRYFMHEGVARFFIVVFVSVMSTLLAIFTVGINKHEREILINFCKQKLLKNRNLEASHE